MIPRDQVLSRTVSYQNQTPDHGHVVRKARKHRNSHVSNTSRENKAKSVKSQSTSRPNAVPRQSSTSTTKTTGSRHSQLVDLVVEDRGAEEQEQIRAQRETGSDWPERDALHLQ